MKGNKPRRRHIRKINSLGTVLLKHTLKLIEKIMADGMRP